MVVGNFSSRATPRLTDGTCLLFSTLAGGTCLLSSTLTGVTCPLSSTLTGGTYLLLPDTYGGYVPLFLHTYTWDVSPAPIFTGRTSLLSHTYGRDLLLSPHLRVGRNSCLQHLWTGGVGE